MKNFYKNLLSLHDDTQTAQLTIKAFKPKSGKTNFIISSAAKLCKNNIPFLLLSNEIEVTDLADRLKEIYRDEYGVDDTSGNWTGCYLASQPTISDNKIFDLCKMYKEFYGVRVLLLDFIKSDSTIAILARVVTDLGMDVISAKQMSAME